MAQVLQVGVAYPLAWHPTGNDLTMKSAIRRTALDLSTKASTGIVGFDEITGGGVPHGRTTLLVGGPGSGKAIFALQFLMQGARACKEPGIFVAFEETPKRIIPG
jgi:predicted ATP-dependent serine protease